MVNRLPTGMDQKFVHRLVCQMAKVSISREREDFEPSCCDPTVGYHYIYFYDENDKIMKWYWEDAALLAKAVAVLTQEQRALYDALIVGHDDLNMQGFIFAGVVTGFYNKDSIKINYEI
jgi:hypothetical protein